MSNPLLQIQDLPDFSAVRPEHVEPAIRQILADNRALFAELTQRADHTWQSLILPIELAEERLDRAWSPVSHMNAVVNSDELRAAYNICLPLLSEYATERDQNAGLYAAYKRLFEEDKTLDARQRRVLELALRDFELSGIALPAEQQARYKAISTELSELASKFSENLLDATNAWSKSISDEAELAGLPESARDLARQAAAQREQDGWLLTLDAPSFLAVITHADNRALRREVYEAYVTRASDLGPHAGQWDNSELIERILRLRHEKAQLLGFANYAELSLARKMADSAEDVLGFLLDLAHRSRPQAEAEIEELREHARQLGLDPLEPWDLTYVSEKLRQARYDISQEQLKPYFPVDKVLEGMFQLVGRLYGLSVRELSAEGLWHPDARLFEILDAKGEQRGRFFMDLYARAKKRSGAWMDSFCGRFRQSDRLRTPVAYMVCNSSPPLADRPALFTHGEVTTLFHEFGHALHHLLTQVDYPEIAGINGVEWDAVELPSQFMENFCWEPEAVELISGHWQTGEPLPAELLERTLAARNFQSAMGMLRQLEFALFDFRLHLEYDPAQGGRVQQLLDQVRDQVSVVPRAYFNRFQHGFSHIFAGGYAAGYYSYKWAEVLSADAFARFEEEGLFQGDAGRDFLSQVLEQGASQRARTLFVNFRGREPDLAPLLRHSGIAA